MDQFTVPLPLKVDFTLKEASYQHAGECSLKESPSRAPPADQVHL